MAGRTCQIGKMEIPTGSGWRGGARAVRVMAFRAGDGDVRAPQGKTRRLVILEAERCRLESGNGVTILAAVGARGGGELCAMRIAMTIQTGLKSRMVIGVGAFPGMALGAGHALMFASDGERCTAMIRFGEGRCSPALYGVAGSAVASAGAVQELRLVRIAMTIHAFLMRHRSLEIGTQVTLQAGDIAMLGF